MATAPGACDGLEMRSLAPGELSRAAAVGCYLSRGFAPTDDPVPELLELEPEDVHMVLDLGLEPDGGHVQEP
jgi:hypothetical protein